MASSHQFGLVLLSVCAVAVSGMTALAMTMRSSAAQGGTRMAWSAGAALSLATGIWSMHFIGMLALRVPLGLSFDVGLIALSFLPALASSAGLLVMSRREKTSVPMVLFASAMTASGIVAMHYLGMLALLVVPRPTYTTASVLYSFAAAFVASFLAFRTMRWFVRPGQRPTIGRLAAAGLALGVGASSMHYLAMSGTHFSDQSVCLTARVPLANADLLGTLAENAWLAMVIFLLLMLMNLAGLLAAIYDARLDDVHMRRAQELEALNNSLECRARELAAELAQEKSIFEAAVDATEDLIFESDPESGRLRVHGDRGSALVGSPVAQVQTADDFLALVHPEERGALREALARAARSAEPVHLELRIRGAQMEWVWTLMRGQMTRVEKGGRSLLVGSISNISSLKAAQSSLEELALQQQELASTRSRIIRILSHELRSPLTIISTGTDLLESMTLPSQEKYSAKVAGYFSNLRDSVGRMEQFLGEMLQLNKMETGEQRAQPSLQPFEPLLRDAIALSCEAERVDPGVIGLTIPDGLRAYCDPSLTALILRNLIGNALKYGEGRPVMVRVSRDGGRTVVDVIDHGIGIPQELQAQLFRPFVRGANVGSIRGTGLGLSLARKSAQNQGGDLVLVASGSQGSHFRLILPEA